MKYCRGYNFKLDFCEISGWKYSRIGDVTMQHVGSSRTALSTAKTNFDSVTMVDSLGCRVSSMKSVCPEHPRQVSSLITTMPFRAFMFQGANSGDEMVLSIRMLGCLLYEDCFPVSIKIFILYTSRRSFGVILNGTPLSFILPPTHLSGFL